MCGNNNSIPVTLTGKAKDLLDHATLGGKILNGLNFPMWKDPQWHRSPYATDMVAWDFLLGKPYGSDADTAYPTGHVRWGLAGTAHSVTVLHVDSDGFATYMQVMNGKKLWAIYRPSPNRPLSNINTFLHSDFQLDRIHPKTKSGLEAVVLRPGDMLCILSFAFSVFLPLYRLMQPGVPHFVYGLENTIIHTIIHGGHFYSSSLMQATLQSLIHTFILNTFISNTFYHPSRQLLRCIVTFWRLALLEKCITPEGMSATVFPFHVLNYFQMVNTFTCPMFKWLTVFLT